MSDFRPLPAPDRFPPARLILLALLAVFLLVTLDHLDTFPPIGEDEPWNATSAYSLATRGVFGTDVLKGFHGTEHHDFHRMPLYPLVHAGILRVAGMGVIQLRILAVLLGALLLLLTYQLGRVLGGERAGILAALLLLVFRLSEGSGALPADSATATARSGILLLDVARVNRNDIAVPVLGLLVLLLFLRFEPRERLPPEQQVDGSEPSGAAWRWLLLGWLVGLSALCHVYGGFWLAILLIALFWRHGPGLLRRREVYLLGAGFVLGVLPWIVYIGAHLADYLGQTRYHRPRFQLGNPRFYLENLASEPQRYQLGLRNLGFLLRPGFWVLVLGLPLALHHMWKRGARIVVVAILVHVVLFAVLLKPKQHHYLIAYWPLAVVSLACAWTWSWQRFTGRAARAGLCLVLLALSVEGVQRIVSRHQSGVRLTRYDDYEARIAAHIPAGSRVLGLQHYWLGLRQFDFRSWLVPGLLSDPRSEAAPISLVQALERVDPDVILVDRHIGDLLSRHREAFAGFLQSRQARILAVLQDATYGKMTIYDTRRARPPEPR